MKKNLFSIGEISEIKGITKKALRFYDRIGLLKPAFIDPENDYRYYSTEQFIQIDIIRAMREIDVSPADIKKILTGKNTEGLLDFLDGQQIRAAARIEEIRRINRTIEGVQSLIRESIDSVAQKGVYSKRIGARSVLTLPYGELPNPDKAILEYSRFDRMIGKYRLVNAYQTGILFAVTENEARPSRIFNAVEIMDTSDASAVETLPEGEYICVSYTAESVLAQQKKLNRYCVKKGLMPSVIIQTDLLHDVFEQGPATAELQMRIG